jgi:hypothetical protein
LAVLGGGTVVVAILPFLKYPATLRRMFTILFHVRSFLDATSSFWKFMELVFDDSIGRNPYPTISMALNLGMLVYAGVLGWQMFKARLEGTLPMGFAIFTLVHYFFGYGIHAKHVMYFYLGLLFLIDTYHHYVLPMNIVMVISMFAESCLLGTEYYVLIHGLAFLPFCKLFDAQSALRANPDLEPDANSKVKVDDQPAPQDEPKTLQRSCRQTVLTKLIQYRTPVLVLQLCVGLVCLAIYQTTVYKYGYTCQQGSNGYIANVVNRTCFVLLLPVLIYWLLSSSQHFAQPPA